MTGILSRIIYVKLEPNSLPAISKEADGSLHLTDNDEVARTQDQYYCGTQKHPCP